MNNPRHSRTTQSRSSVFLLLVICLLFITGDPANADQPMGTFSIIAYDSLTGEIGGAVQSKVLAVGRSVIHAEAGIGAVATQAQSNYSFGPDGLNLLSMDVPVEQVIDVLTSKDPQREVRQLGVIDAQGNSASYTGKNCSNWAGHLFGSGYAIQGNILAAETVVTDMERAFLENEGSLPERLLAALQAGQEAGGDSRGQQSAGLLVRRKGFIHFVDLRVDDHETPITELLRIYKIHQRTYEPGNRIYAASLLLKEGKNEQAEHELEFALKVADEYPDDADLQNNVAWGLAINDLLLNDALKLARRAVKCAPDVGYIWDTLGEVHYRQGNLKDAVRAQSKAVETAPEEPLFKKRLDAWREELKTR